MLSSAMQNTRILSSEIWRILFLLLTFTGARLCNGNALTDLTPPSAKSIGDQSTSPNNKLEIAQRQLISIQTKFKTMINNYNVDMSKMEGDMSKLESDLSKLESQIADLTDRLDKTELLAQENEQKIMSLTETVTTLGGDMAGMKENVDNLEEANRIWKNNFIVINRTFNMLRSSARLSPST